MQNCEKWWSGNADLFACLGRGLVASFLMLTGLSFELSAAAPKLHWPTVIALALGWIMTLLAWVAGEYVHDTAPKTLHTWWVGTWIAGGAAIVLSLLDPSFLCFGVAICGTVNFFIGLAYWPEETPRPSPLVAAPPAPPTTFGSARWGTLDYMRQHNLVGHDGLMVGVIPGDAEPHRLRYKGDRHLLTLAPTGSGKGTTAIIPNLLSHRASCLVVDPKGENALITARARAAMGQSIHIVDPWGAASEAGPTARFNPLDWLVVGDLDIAENAMLLADALVVNDGKEQAFWLEEAKALLQGVILYVATDEHEVEDRHLGRVRDLLLLDGEHLPQLFQRMTQSLHHVVASTGARSLQKDEKLLSNVLASAQSHTLFLDSPRIRQSLSASDFTFADLKTTAMTVYLVLPADRLNAFGRWLRLLIQQAITVNARNIAHQPAQPVLFILDEMASLGRLSMVKEAYGLMRGFGMQLWGIVQDAGQLREIYGEGWEGFIANSGAVIYDGSRDNYTAAYFSKLCGEATVLNFSTSTSHSTTLNRSYSTGQSGGGSSSGVSSTSGATLNASRAQRKLAFPD